MHEFRIRSKQIVGSNRPRKIAYDVHISDGDVDGSAEMRDERLFGILLRLLLLLLLLTIISIVGVQYYLLRKGQHVWIERETFFRVDTVRIFVRVERVLRRTSRSR